MENLEERHQELTKGQSNVFRGLQDIWRR